MIEEILTDLKKVLSKIGFNNIDPFCYIPENPEFGDYSTNVPLQLSNQKSKNDKQSSFEIANEILKSFGHPPYIERIEIAGPGFINFYLKDEALVENLTEKPKGKKSNKKVLLEYASPNYFKPFHIGHLRNIVTGESIARLLKFIGEDIFKVTYNSDIGLSTAKAIWGVKRLKKEYENVKEASLKEKVKFLGKSYILGSNSYEDNPKIKKEIEEINIKLYQKDSEILQLWLEAREWSNGYLISLYSRLGTEFDAEIWESEVGEVGKKIVEENIGKIFKKDNGAVIFPAEEYGLHTRVFVNSAGNPTYEAKDIGNALRELELYQFDEAIHVVANEQAEYFKVVFKAIELVEASLIGKKKHLSYGFVNLSTGKMSSRKGNVITAEDLIDEIKMEIRKQFNKTQIPSEERITEQVAIGAVKFFLLKFGVGTDIAFDIQKSISLQGDSGPYVQYAYVRTQSVLEKSKKKAIYPGKPKLNDEERKLLRQIEYFNLIVTSAANELRPNELCEYLLDLAKAFNLFYQKHSILGSDEEEFRLLLITKVGDTLKEGLYLLGIESPERM